MASGQRPLIELPFGFGNHRQFTHRAVVVERFEAKLPEAMGPLMSRCIEDVVCELLQREPVVNDSLGVVAGVEEPIETLPSTAFQVAAEVHPVCRPSSDGGGREPIHERADEETR